MIEIPSANYGRRVKLRTRTRSRAERRYRHIRVRIGGCSKCGRKKVPVLLLKGSSLCRLCGGFSL